MADIDSKLMGKVNVHAANTSTYYKKLQMQNKLAWLIAMVPTYDWAHQVYPQAKDPLNKLWETIFNLCNLNSVKPHQELKKELQKNKNICEKLNNLKIKELHYTNKLGTDLTVGLSKKSIWCTTVSHLQNGQDIVCNFPSFEVFTTPDKYQVNGIVYSSLPLLNSGVVIEDFSLEFRNGKVTKVQAKKNASYLQEIMLIT